MECRSDETGSGWNVEEIGRPGMECRRDKAGRG
jgi:hypothetical protein